MKWFKHYVDTGDSRALAAFRRAVGREGMCRYWDLLAFLANKFDGETCHFVIPRESLQRVFGFRSWTGLRSFADRLATIPGLNVKQSGNDYEIEAPILLDLLGRDFRVARQARAKTAPKNKNKKKSNNISEDAKKLFSFWNQNRGPLPEADSFTDKRKQRASAQLRKYPSIEKDWLPVLERWKSSVFCTEQWRPGFDDLLSEEKRTKTKEGKYDDRNQKAASIGGW